VIVIIISMNIKKYGEKIKTARERIGLSQYELAERVGCTDAYVSMIENGRRTPSIEMILQFAQVLGTPKMCPTCGKKI
jgi:transcriptional regulator with XRE-family HTH domain